MDSGTYQLGHQIHTITPPYTGEQYINVDNLISFGYPFVPCGINLPNVLCVGGTDPLDNLFSYSNFGTFGGSNSAVAVGAPAVEIYSTSVVQYHNINNGTELSFYHTYGAINTTGGSASIAAGAAALILSMIGAADGNYFQASEVRGRVAGPLYLFECGKTVMITT